MNRRTLLARLGGLVGTGVLAGCLRDAGGPTGPAPAPATATATPRSSPAPAFETVFEVVDRRCGSGENQAAVAFADGEIAIDGTIVGGDPCRTAALEEVAVTDGGVEVRVTTVEEASTETTACAQCVADIDYRAIVTPLGAAPDAVTVVHRSMGSTETVARAKRD